MIEQNTNNSTQSSATTTSEITFTPAERKIIEGIIRPGLTQAYIALAGILASRGLIDGNPINGRWQFTEITGARFVPPEQPKPQA